MAENRQKRTTPPPKVALNPANFDRVIEDHGTYVRVTPSIVCPRRSGARIELDDTNHDLNCPLCQGALTIDVTESAFETWAFIQGIKIEKMLNANGIFDIKDAFASFKPGVRVHYWYKIEILDFATQYNEIVKRGASKNDALRYDPLEPTGDGNRFIVVDSDGKRFEYGSDFTVEDRSLIWGSNAPKAGKLYSALYPVLPTFRVLEMMHENRQYYVDAKLPDRAPKQMPQQVHIRWDFMARKQGSDRQL